MDGDHLTLPRDSLRWLEFQASESAAHPDVMTQIRARTLDGVTVNGVFSSDECARAVSALEQHTDRVSSMFGYMLGLPLANMSMHAPDPGDLSIYFEDADRCRQDRISAFGFDPHDRVAHVLEPMCGGRSIDHPRDGELSYSPGNVRWFLPELGGLRAHVGNEFNTHSDEVSAQLRSTTTTLDHFSWFVILQAPEIGGELSVYDLVFETHTPEDPDYGELGRDDSEFDRQEAKRIAPEVGAMVFFGGGWRWHRVEVVRGSRPRVTYGGFAGPSVDDTSLNLWF